jgi:L-aminopeptidase/D-esterase-like protein
MAELIDGVRVGHWTDDAARTGCTVVLLPEGTVASGEVRGGAPASREFALLAPERSVEQVHAVCLSGGSAFGLAAGDGVVTELARAGVGYPTPGGPVPIVVGLSLFDLTVGDGSARPGPEQGARAASSAEGGTVAVGLVGAGTGATVGKWDDPADAQPGGIAVARVEADGVSVVALLAVNAAGWIDGRADRVPRSAQAPFGGNTTIGVVLTDAAVGKVDCLRMAQGGHDGLARAIVPAHTGRDGDALVAAATGSAAGGSGATDGDLVRWMAATAVEQAIGSLP